MASITDSVRRRIRSTKLEMAGRIWRLYEVTGGRKFRVKNLHPEDIGYMPDQKTQLYRFCRQLSLHQPDLIHEEEDPGSGVKYYVWISTPPKVEGAETDSEINEGDQFRILRAEMEALHSFVSSLSSRVQDLEAWENSVLQDRAAQVASTLVGLSPPQQEYVLRLVADLAAGKKSDK